MESGAGKRSAERFNGVAQVVPALSTSGRPRTTSLLVPVKGRVIGADRNEMQIILACVGRILPMPEKYGQVNGLPLPVRDGEDSTALSDSCLRRF